MKKFFLVILFTFMVSTFIDAQNTVSEHSLIKEMHSLIEKYTQARDKSDTLLLESILTPEVDQLVSSGTWRRGKPESMSGMLRSSDSNPGSRKITVEKVRFLNSECAIVDTRYEIQNANGTDRKMWSTFIVVLSENTWKISAIRNMLPAGQN